MVEPSTESIIHRLQKLTTAINSCGLETNSKHSVSQHLLAKEGLLDALLVLYDECNNDALKTDKYITAFIDKYRSCIYELRRLRVNLNDFEQKKVIGKGYFGVVQVVREKNTGNVYALKTLRKADTLAQQHVAFYEEERDIMAKATSLWLTHLQFAFQDEQNLYLLMDFHPGGDLLSLLDRFQYRFSENMTRFYCSEITVAIHAVHSMGYVHRDIKPDNILIDRCGHIKLVDFGSAAKLTASKLVRSQMPVGTPYYIAPEVLVSMNEKSFRSCAYGIECDYWSLGIMAYEMLYGETPFKSGNVVETYSNIMNYKEKLKFNDSKEVEVSEVAKMLIRGLLDEAGQRLTYNGITKHKFFFHTDWNNLQSVEPPFIPVVTSVDDTSNFEEFENETLPPSIDSFRSKQNFSGWQLPFIGFTYARPDSLHANDWCSLTPSLANITLNSTLLEESLREPTKLELELKAKRKELHEALMKIKIMQSEKDKNLLEMEKRTILAEKRAQRCEESLKVAQLECAEQEKKVKKLKSDLEKQKTERVNTEGKTLEFLKAIKEKWVKEEQEKTSNFKEKLQFYEQSVDKLNEEKNELIQKLGSLRKELLLEKEECVRHRKWALDKNNEVLKLMKENEEYTPLKSVQQRYEETSLLLESEKKSQWTLNMQLEELQKKNYNLEIRIAEISASERENVKLLSEVDVLKEDLNKRAKEFEVSQHKLKLSQEQALKQKEMKVDDLCAQLESKETDCVNLQHQLKETADKLRDALVKSSSKEKLFMTRNEQLEVTLKEVEVELMKLNKEKLQLLAELAHFSTREDQHKGKLAESEMLLASLNTTLAKSALVQSTSDDRQRMLAQVELLEKQLATSIASSLADKEKLHNTEDELRKKTQEALDVKLDYRSLQREMKSSQDTLQYLRERTKELREQVKEKEDEIKNSAVKEESLQKEIERLKGEIRDLKVNHKSALEVKQEAIKKCEEKLEENKMTLNEMKDLQKTLMALQTEAANLKAEKCDLVSEIKILNQTSDLGKKQEVFLKQAIKDLEAKVSCTQTLVENLKEVCCAQDNELLVVGQFEERVTILESEKLVLKNTIEELQNELKSCRSSLNEEKSLKLFQEKMVKDLENRITTTNEAIDASVVTLRQQLDSVSKENTQLQIELEALEEHLQEVRLKEGNLEHEKIHLTSELDVVKEEASGHIRYIHSLKESNFKLTDGLDDAVTKAEVFKRRIEELDESVKQLQATSDAKELQLKSTVQQQTKLIDFLQSKSEQAKKKTAFSRLFGTSGGPKEKENELIIPPHYRKMEDLLEREKAHTKQLSNQLSKAHSELVNLKASIAHENRIVQNTPQSSSTPKQKRFLEDISNSPTFQGSNTQQRMRHKIPHRWHSHLVMRAGRCCGCLGNVPFSRHAVRCQDCGLMAHSKCSEGIGNTCGLPEEFALHYTQSKKKLSGSDQPNVQEQDFIIKGWVKVPRSGRAIWERKYACLVGQEIQFFDQEMVSALSPSFIVSLDDRQFLVVIHNEVPKSEIPTANKMELPYVLKIELLRKTSDSTSFISPIFIMTSTFEEKQKWISALGTVVLTTIEEPVDVSKGRLDVDLLITLQSVTSLDVTSLVFLSNKTALMGAAEGLFSLERTDKGKMKFRARIEGLTAVHQIILVKAVGVAVFIAGEENLGYQNDLGTLEAGAEAVQVAKPSISPLRIDPLIGCHLIAASEYSSKMTYLCAAASDRISILVWSVKDGVFVVCRQYSTQEPCSCFLFTPTSLIVGAERFYKIDLKRFTIKEYLDGSDSSLSYAIYGSSQMSSFPVAIIQIYSSEKVEEYLLAFYEFAIFVDAEGRRTREYDLKFSRLPVAVAFRLPYLFILHQNAVDILELKLNSFTKVRGTSFDSDTECAPPVRTVSKTFSKPRFIGNCMKPHCVLLASACEKNLEILSISAAFPEDPDASCTWSAVSSVRTLPINSEEESDSESVRSDSSVSDPNSSKFKRTRFPSFMRASKRNKKLS